MTTISQSTKGRTTSIRLLTVTAMLSAIAYILAFIEFPMPLSPSFAKMDLSDFPALIGAFAFGPLTGMMVELVKNVLQLMSTSTAGVGELANFAIGASFVLTAGAVYGNGKRKPWVACAIGSVVMSLAAAVMNYYVLLPVFEQFMPMEQIIAEVGKLLPFIQTKLDMVLFNVFPTTLFKGVVISVLTLPIHKKLSAFLIRR